MITGYPIYDSNNAEVITETVNATFMNSRVCDNQLNYPEQVEFATGGLVGDTTLLICGGQREGRDITDKCYTYDFKSSQNKWLNHTSMTTARVFSSSVVIQNDMLWITGGNYKYENTLATTELISLNRTKLSSPNLIEPIESHCMVSFGEMIFIIGGAKTPLLDSKGVTQVSMYLADDIVNGIIRPKECN